jgi:hypothetical protein
VEWGGPFSQGGGGGMKANKICFAQRRDIQCLTGMFPLQLLTNQTYYIIS